MIPDLHPVTPTLLTVDLHYLLDYNSVADWLMAATSLCPKQRWPTSTGEALGCRSHSTVSQSRSALSPQRLCASALTPQNQLSGALTPQTASPRVLSVHRLLACGLASVRGFLLSLSEGSAPKLLLHLSAILVWRREMRLRPTSQPHRFKS